MWLLIAKLMISLLQISFITMEEREEKNRHYTNKLIENQHNIFSFERVEDVCPLPGAGQHSPLPLLLPPTCSAWGWSPQCWSLPRMQKWQKLWWGLPHTRFLCLLTLLLGLNYFPQPLQANTWPLCCQILCWLGICKDLKALSQTLQECALSLSCTLSPYSDLIQQHHHFPNKHALDTCRSMHQQISSPLHVLLKADPHLEGDVADDKADPLVCLQLNQISVL